LKTLNKYIIAIDAGATGTEAMLYSTESGIVKEKIYPPINYNLSGEKQTVKKLISIVHDILKNKYSAPVLVAGISGARHEKERKQIKNALKQALKITRIEILPDTEIAFAASFDKNEKNCGILIAGTGSILYYKDNTGNMKRAGGWGRHIGDEGSGYWIGKEALNKLGKYFDGAGPQTKLDVILKKHFGIKNETMLAKVYHEKIELSQIAEHVFRCAESGDAVSKKIIYEAAEHLAGHLDVLKNKNYKIALLGSLFQKEMLLEKYLKKIVKSDYPKIKIIKSALKPVWGAVKIGMRF